MYYRFIKKFLCFSVSLILSIMTINYIIDPFNIYSVATIQGLSHVKPEFQSRLTVALNTIKFKPKTIVLGTSRAVHIPKEGLGNLCEEPFYNAGISGASFDEIHSYFLHALYLQPDLKRVILGIDLFSFHADRKPQIDFKSERIQNKHVNFNDLKDTLISYNALAASCKCAYLSFFDIEIINPIIEMGDNVYLQKMLESSENYKNYRIDPEKIEKFKNFVEICRNYKIDLQVYISPVKAFYWEFYYQNGLWPHVEDLKKQLCAIYPIWDFSGYNPITLETLDSDGESLYFECSHFTPYIGKLLVKRMLGETSSIDSIGYRLTPENVESILIEILDQRLQWLKIKKFRLLASPLLTMEK